MGRLLLASVIGAALVFAWGFVAWPMMHLYKSAFRDLPHESAVVDMLKADLKYPSAYMFPAPPADSNDKAGMDAWAKRHTEGPVGTILFTPAGEDPMAVMMMVRGFGIDFLACLLLSVMMVAGRMRSFALRFGLAFIMAAFAVLVSYAQNRNWFSYPNPYTAALSLDLLIAWTIGGFAVALIVKPTAPAQAIADRRESTGQARADGLCGGCFRSLRQILAEQ